MINEKEIAEYIESLKPKKTLFGYERLSYIENINSIDAMYRKYIEQEKIANDALTQELRNCITAQSEQIGELLKKQESSESQCAQYKNELNSVLEKLMQSESAKTGYEKKSNMLSDILCNMKTQQEADRKRADNERKIMLDKVTYEAQEQAERIRRDAEREKYKILSEIDELEKRREICAAQLKEIASVLSKQFGGFGDTNSHSPLPNERSDSIV